MIDPSTICPDKTMRTELSKKKDSEEKEDSFSNELMETRTIVISGSVDSKLTDKIVKQLLVLEKKDPKKNITMFINSPGGEIYSGYAIFDMMKLVSCPITTVVMGLAASMGSILSLAGDDGRRFALSNAGIMIHQPLLSGAEGQATDLEIHAKQLLKSREAIAELYAEKSGKSVAKILKDLDRDHWLTAKEAVKYGLIDKVITKRSEL
jgi:ATP-dependent Clp protease, protease subunit